MQRRRCRPVQRHEIAEESKHAGTASATVAAMAASAAERQAVADLGPLRRQRR